MSLFHFEKLKCQVQASARTVMLREYFLNNICFAVISNKNKKVGCKF